MGYEVVEFYAPYFSWTPEQAKDVRKLLDDLGIRCNSTHNSTSSFTAEGLPKAIELNQIIGSKNIILASAGGVDGIDGWKVLGEQMTKVSETLQPLGMGTGFHNHETEWAGPVGQRPMDVLAANTPKEFTLQLDVGTVIEAGADPLRGSTRIPGASAASIARTGERGKTALIGFCSAKAMPPGRKSSRRQKASAGSSII